MLIKQQYPYRQYYDPSTGILKGIIQMLPHRFTFTGATLPVEPIISSYANNAQLQTNACAVSVGLLYTEPIFKSNFENTYLLQDDENIKNTVFEDFRKAKYRIICYAPDCFITRSYNHKITFDSENDPLGTTYTFEVPDYGIKDFKVTYNSAVIQSRIADPPVNSMITIPNTGNLVEGTELNVTYSAYTSGVFIANDLAHNIQKNIDTYMNEADNFLFKQYNIGEYKIGVITSISDALFTDNYHGASFDIIVNYPTYRLHESEGDKRVQIIDDTIHLNEDIDNVEP